MKAMRDFSEFIKDGIVKRQRPDKSRARFLASEAGRDYLGLIETVEKMKVDDTKANMFVKSCYDVIMEFIRSRMLLEGYNASGPGAHEAEVSYMRTLGFSGSDVQFTDQMRFFRNGMLYYGIMVDRTYAEKVVAFTKRIYPILKKLSDA